MKNQSRSEYFSLILVVGLVVGAAGRLIVCGPPQASPSQLAEDRFKYSEQQEHARQLASNGVYTVDFFEVIKNQGIQTSRLLHVRDATGHLGTILASEDNFERGNYKKGLRYRFVPNPNPPKFGDKDVSSLSALDFLIAVQVK